MNTTPLRQARKSAGYSLAYVEQSTGIDRAALSRIERGLQGATPSVAEKLALFFGHRVTEMQILYPQRYMSTAA